MRTVSESVGLWRGGADACRCRRRLAPYPCAFTLVELLSVVAIICVLAALTFPAFSVIRSSGDNARCMANLRVLHQAAISYMSENDQRLPVAFSNDTQVPWFSVFATSGYLPITRVSGSLFAPCLGCPSQRRTVHNPKATTYGMNGSLCRDSGSQYPRRQQTVVAPSKTMLFGDGSLLANGTFNVQLYQGGSLPRGAHDPNEKNVNLVFMDGHVESRAASDIPPIAWPGGPTDAMMFWNGTP